MEFVIFWVLCGIAASYVAGQKNKSAGNWFILGLLLGPFALLMVGFAPAGQPGQSGRKSFRLTNSTRTEKVIAFILAPIFPYGAAMLLIPIDIMAKAYAPIVIGIVGLTWLALWRPLMRTPRKQAAGATSQPLIQPVQLRQCPFCAEDIKYEAIVCKHCGRDVPAAPAPKPEPLIQKCYNSLQREHGGAMDQGRARLELENQGFGPLEVAAFLDSLPR